MAREILEPLLPLARSGSLGNLDAAVIPALARVAPDRVLGMIENRAIADLSGTLVQVALGPVRGRPGGGDRDDSGRPRPWLEGRGMACPRGLPSGCRARAIENLLDRALAETRKTMRAPGRSVSSARLPTAGWSSARSHGHGQSCSKPRVSWPPGRRPTGYSRPRNSPRSWPSSTFPPRSRCSSVEGR